MNYYERHLGDYARDTGHLSILEHGVYTLLLDRYYASEKPLPADVRECCKLARAASKPERDAVAYVLREFFELRETGHHNKRADGEIERFQEKQDDRDEQRKNEAERQRRHRARRKELFEALREAGEVPKYDTPTSDLEEMLSRVTCRDITQYVTRDATANQTPDTSNHTKAKAKAPSTHATELPQSPQTEAGRACRLMREAGCTQTNPSHPVLVAALKAGVTPEALADTAREAIEAKKMRPFLWAINTARGRLSDPEPITVNGDRHATHRPSATDRVAANIERARQRDREHLAVIEGSAKRITG